MAFIFFDNFLSIGARLDLPSYSGNQLRSYIVAAVAAAAAAAVGAAAPPTIPTRAPAATTKTLLYCTVQYGRADLYFSSTFQ